MATALAEGLRMRLGHLGGILSLQKNSEKHTRYCKKQNYDNENNLRAELVMENNKLNGKESLSDKYSTQ